MVNRALLWAPQWWAPGILLVGLLFSSRLLAKEGGHIELFRPYFFLIECQDCPEDSIECDIILKTRANTYNVMYYNLALGYGDSIELVEAGTFKEPAKLISASSWIKSEEVDSMAQVVAFTGGSQKGCRVRSQLHLSQGESLELCSREATIVIRHKTRTEFPLFSAIGKELLPITALSGRVLTDLKYGNFIFEIMGTYMSGTIFRSLHIIGPQTQNKFKSIGFNLMDPTTRGNYQKLDAAMEEKYQGAYVQAITPIFSESSQESDDIPLCLSSGLKRKGNINLSCLHKGVDQISFMTQLKVSNQASKVLIHALLMFNLEGISNLHIVYSLITKRSEGSASSEFRYIHCARGKKFEEGKHYPRNSDHTLILDSAATEANGQQCGAQAIEIPPNDIIGFNDGTCAKTISLYGNRYTTHALKEPIIGKQNEVKFETLNQFPSVYINAAFAWRKKIYFFVHSNDLLIYDAQMTDGCKQLSLMPDSVQVKISQEFILPRILGNDKKHLFAEPYLNDYLQSSKEFTVTQPPPVDKDWVSQDDPTIGALPILLVLGVLIAGAIVYLFVTKTVKIDDITRLIRPKPTSAGPRKSSVIISAKSAKTPRSPLKTASRGAKNTASRLKSPSSMKSTFGGKTPKSRIIIKSPKSPKSSTKMSKTSSPH